MVTCPYCNRDFKGDKLNARHLSKCNPSLRKKVRPCLCGHEATSNTQMKRHHRTCEVWQSRDKEAVKRARMKETMLEEYGVEHPRQSSEIEARREATNLERYGATNPFARESSVFDKVQAAQEGKRPVLKGQDNPFAWPEVKAKIRETMAEKYGAPNPQQVPEIRARTRETCHERYGGELLGSPILEAKARATNEARYGDAFPQRTEPVKARQRETNLERYGVPWTSMDPEVRRKQLETMEANWGSHFFASEEGKEKIRQVMQERYGVDHWMKLPDSWDKLVGIFRERFGVDHPLQLEDFLEKRMGTCREIYGVDHPLQNEVVMAKVVATNQDRYGAPYPLQNPEVLERAKKASRKRFGSDFFVGSEAYKAWSQEKYGTDHPMQNKEYARVHLERMRRPGPNMFESKVASLAPEKRLLYTGDGSWWRWLPKLGKHKNPDFIVPGPYPTKPKKGVTQVVEAFGDWWHSRIYTGKAPFDHEQELIEAFADIGIRCLVIWESELKADPEAVRGRLGEFLDGPEPSPKEPESEGLIFDLFGN
jgi:hypothetical protein